jgi:hypothetical protein
MVGRQVQDTVARASSARLALSRPAPQTGQLALALQGWQLMLLTAEAGAVEPMADTDLVQRTLDLAEQSGMIVIEAGTRTEMAEEIGGRSYRAVPYIVKARGSLSAAERLLYGLERHLSDTIEISDAIVTNDGDEYLLSVSSVVYSHLTTPGSQTDEAATEEPSAAPVSIGAEANR